MKLSKLPTLSLLLTLLAAVMLFTSACKKDEPPELEAITGVSFSGISAVYDGEERSIEVAGTLPEGVTVEYENNRATDAGTYLAKATLSGDGYKTLVLNAALVIEKAPLDTTFTGASHVYDGEEKSLAITDTLPEGVTVTYEGNGNTDAGVYTVTAKISGGKNYQDKTLSASLIIAKADIEGITLPSLIFEYDGEEKSLELSGELPEGVTVSFEGNGQSEVGSHPVKATLTGKNYNEQVLTAFITIKEKEVIPPVLKDIEGVTFDNVEYTYDGTQKTVDIVGELPEGVKVEYIGNTATKAGTYKATVRLYGDGYNTLTLNATLTIKKATIEGVTFEGKVKNYTGYTYTISVSGNIPDGVEVEYTNNTGSAAGTYKATATLTGENYETLVLEAVLVIKASTGSGITTPEHDF